MADSIFLVLPTIAIDYHTTDADRRDNTIVLESFNGNYRIIRELHRPTDNRPVARYFKHKKKIYGVSASSRKYIIFDLYKNEIIEYLNGVE